VSQRTAIINQIRAFLLERGTVFAEKPAKLKVAMADVLENADNALTPMMGNLIDILWNEWSTVEEQIDELTDRLEQIAANDAGCCRIRQIPGTPSSPSALSCPTRSTLRRSCSSIWPEPSTTLRHLCPP